MGPTLALLTVLQANKLEDNEDIVGTRNDDFIQKASRPRRWQAGISKKTIFPQSGLRLLLYRRGGGVHCIPETNGLVGLL